MVALVFPNGKSNFSTQVALLAPTGHTGFTECLMRMKMV